MNMLTQLLIKTIN